MTPDDAVLVKKGRILVDLDARQRKLRVEAWKVWKHRANLAYSVLVAPVVHVLTWVLLLVLAASPMVMLGAWLGHFLHDGAPGVTFGAVMCGFLGNIAVVVPFVNSVELAIEEIRKGWNDLEAK